MSIRSFFPGRLPQVWLHWTGACVLAAATCLPIYQTSATVVIAPNTLPDENNLSGPDIPASQTYGDTSNLLPFFPGAGTALQYQQVYDATQFTAFAAGGEDITEISFRVGIEAPDRADHGAFTATIPFIEISLSTTQNSAANLDTTFSNNVGTDAVTVFGAPGVGSPLSLSSTGAPLTGTAPAPFDITIVLTTAFHYDPSQGNLLLSVTNYEGADSPTNIQLDGTSDEASVGRVYNFGSTTSDTATSSDSEGLVTQFTTGAVVPEPGSPTLLLALLISVPVFIFYRRRQRSQTP